MATKWRPDPEVIYRDLVETLRAIDAPDRDSTVRVGDRITVSAYALDYLLMAGREGTLVDEDHGHDEPDDLCDYCGERHELTAGARACEGES